MNDSERPSDSRFPLTNNSGNARPDNATANTIWVNSRRTPPARPRTFWTYLKWTSATFACIAAVAAGTVLGILKQNPYVSTAMQGISTIQGIRGLIQGNPLAVYTPDQQMPADKQHAINVLMLGCDSDYEDTRPVALKGKNGRSDSMMMAHIDFDAKTIKVLSIPRDTAVRIPGHGIDKINAAYAIGGPDLTKATIKDVFGLDTDYFIRLDFDSFQKVVDAVGGVDLTVDKKLDYDDNWANLHVHLKPGYQHLNGYHAMGYVRMRHSDSDLMRADRQHEFLEALRKKVKSPATLLKIPAILTAVTDDLKTDLTPEQVLTLTNFARQLPKENIQLATLPSYEGPSYVYVNIPQAQEVIRKMFYNDEMIAVNINVPDRSEVHGPVRRYAMDTRTYRRRHGRRWTHSSTAPNDDTGGPSLADPDSMMDDEIVPVSPANDSSSGSSDTTGSDTTSGSGSNGTDKSGASGKSDSGSGSGSGTHDKSGDSGSGSDSGSGGTDKTGDGGSGGSGDNGGTG